MRAGLRPTLRTLRQNAQRRANASSSSSSPAQNEQVQKAVEGAQKVYAQGAAAVSRVAGPVGERVGSFLGSWQEPLVFNFKTFTSLCRQVYKAEKLAFPTDLHTWTSAYSHIWARGSNVGWWRETLKTGAWAGVSIAALEFYGLFSLGEIIGRRNLVGYKLKEPEH